MLPVNDFMEEDVAETKHVVGIDLGATNLKIGIVSSSGEIKERLSVPVNNADDSDKVIAFIAEKLKGLVAKTSIPVLAVGCGIPGIVDSSTGHVYKSPNFPVWRDAPIQDNLSKAVGLPVIMDNDANIYAIGEHRFGAGKGLKNMVLLTLGTGIGGGLILNGNLFHGDIGFAGEVGHIVVKTGGAKCGCGRKGCWEQYAASRAFSVFAAELDESNRIRLLNDARVEDLSQLTPKRMAELAGGGHGIALSLWKKFGIYLGIGMADLINILGVTSFVIGGGIAASWDLFIDAAKGEIPKHTYKENAVRVSIEKAVLGNDAGIIGAAAEALTLI